jgi:hypothetical protein
VTSWAQQLRASREQTTSHGHATTTPTVRIGHLSTPAGIRREQLRLYKAARRAAGPNPTPEQVTKLAYVLSCLYRSTECEEIGERLQELSVRLAALEQTR